MKPTRLYYIAMYKAKEQAGEYIESDNLLNALKNFNLLHNCEGYESLIIRRIYRQMQLSKTIEQIARQNTQKINLIKQQKK